jgi:hypothetical protein
MNLSLSHKETAAVAMVQSDRPSSGGRAPRLPESLRFGGKGPRWGTIIGLVLLADVTLAIAVCRMVGVFMR